MTLRGSRLRVGPVVTSVGSRGPRGGFSDVSKVVNGMAIFDGYCPTPERTYRRPERWQGGFRHRGTGWALHAKAYALEEFAGWASR